MVSGVSLCGRVPAWPGEATTQNDNAHNAGMDGSMARRATCTWSRRTASSSTLFRARNADLQYDPARPVARTAGLRYEQVETFIDRVDGCKGQPRGLPCLWLAPARLRNFKIPLAVVLLSYPDASENSSLIY